MANPAFSLEPKHRSCFGYGQTTLHVLLTLVVGEMVFLDYQENTFKVDLERKVFFALFTQSSPLVERSPQTKHKSVSTKTDTVYIFKADPKLLC